MSAVEFCSILPGNSHTPKPFSSNLEGPDGDEIAALLDNVPELDSIFYLTKKIGHGTFSSVYLGQTKKVYLSGGRSHFAVKHIIPTSHPSRVYMELKCLNIMGGKDNIIEASLCLRNLNHIVLVMPYFPHDSFVDLVGTLSSEEVADYIFNLCLALRKEYVQAKESRKSNEGNKSKSLSTSITETPHLTASRGVKRILAISNMSSSPDCGDASKKSRVSPSNSLPIKSAFSSTKSAQIFDCVRRSPRKLPSSLCYNFYKENIPETKQVGTEVKSAEKESPKENRKMNLEDTHHKSQISLQSKEPITEIPWKPNFFTPNILRRSPRKIQKRGCDGPFRENSPSLNNVFESSAKSGIGSSNFGASLTGHSFSGTPQSLYGSRTNATLREVKTRSVQGILQPSSCSCYGGAKVCPRCLGRSSEHAPRAGTPGFRAPEVLLRHPHQTTAIDMWAVGVILLCLLSGRYPFFRAIDDLSSLTEITTIVGTKAMKKVAANLGKLFTTSEDVPALDLRKVCEKLRKQNQPKETKPNAESTKETSLCKGCKQAILECICLKPADSSKVLSPHKDNSIDKPKPLNECEKELNNLEHENAFESSVYDLLCRLLDPNPDKRLTADQALQHEFLNLYLKK